MKLQGKKLDTPKTSLCVIPRDEGDLVFKFRAVVDETEFDKLCPYPNPPKKQLKGGVQVENFEDPGYKSAIHFYASKRTDWLFLTSIKETPALEWETIDLADVSTWGNWKEELGKSGFSSAEQMAIYNAFTDANSLNSAKVEEAKQRFLASQSQVTSPPSTLPVEQVNT